MPIDPNGLSAIALDYTSSMTSIRGRRVQRLLKREFARFDHVLEATADDGAPVLLALAEDGSTALCRTDGRGPVAGVAQWGTLPGVTVTTHFDLLKDSLPIVRWTVWHASFAGICGVLTIEADRLRTDAASVATALQR